MSDRLPPSNIDMECAALGACLIERAAAEDIAEILQPRDFYREQHVAIYEAILSLLARDVAPDILSVQDELRERGLLEICGGPAALILLTDALPTTANAAWIAERVREAAVQRRLLGVRDRIDSLVYSGEPLEDVLTGCETALYEVTQAGTPDRATSLRDIMVEVLREVEQRAAAGGGLRGIPTGLPDLDYMTSGLCRQNLYILAGRTSMGKSAMAIGFALSAARFGVGTLLFSLEMSKKEIGYRLAAMASKVSLTDILNGRFASREDAAAFQNAAAACDALQVFVDDRSGLTPVDVRRRLRREHTQHPIGLLIVDHAQLMRGARQTENRVLELGEISQSLKALAKEQDIPVVLLCQVNRGVESRQDKIPELSDLRESGRLEEDADCVLMLYRPEYYKRRASGEEPPAVEEAVCFVRKQRNGPTGQVPLAYRAACARFETMREEDEVI